MHAVVTERSKFMHQIHVWMPVCVYVFLLLSPFSISLFVIEGHYIFEIPLGISILYGLLVRDEIFYIAKRALRPSPLKIFIFVLITGIFLIGWERYGSFASAYGDYRGNLMVVVGFLVGQRMLRDNPELLVRMGVVSGLIYLLFFLKSLGIDATYLKFPSSYLALAVAVVVSSWMMKIRAAVVSLSILFILAAISFYRQYWVVAILMLLFFCGSHLVRKRRIARRVPLVALSILVVLSIFGYVFSDAIANFFSQSAHYYQLVSKTQLFFASIISGSGNSMHLHDQSDALRFAYFKFIADYPLMLVVPHGLGYSEVYGKLFPWFFGIYPIKANTIDSSAFYIAYSYGIFILFAVLLWVIKLGFHLFIRRGIFEAVSLVLVVFVVLLFDGGQIVVILDAFWLGAFLAISARPLRKSIPCAAVNRNTPLYDKEAICDSALAPSL